MRAFVCRVSCIGCSFPSGHHRTSSGATACLRWLPSGSPVVAIKVCIGVLICRQHPFSKLIDLFEDVVHTIVVVHRMRQHLSVLIGQGPQEVFRCVPGIPQPGVLHQLVQTQIRSLQSLSGLESELHDFTHLCRRRSGKFLKKHIQYQLNDRLGFEFHLAITSPSFVSTVTRTLPSCASTSSRCCLYTSAASPPR